MSNHTNPLSTTQIILVVQVCMQVLILVALACMAYLVYHTRTGSRSKNNKSATTSMFSDPDLQDLSQLDEAIIRMKSHLEESTVLRDSTFEKLNQVVDFLSTADTGKTETTNHEDLNVDAGSDMTIIGPLDPRKRSVSAPSPTTAVHEVSYTAAPIAPSTTNKIAMSNTLKATDHSPSDPKLHPPTVFADAKANLEEAISILSTDTSRTSTLLHSHLSILANTYTLISTLDNQLKTLRSSLLAKDKALTSTTTESTNKSAEIQRLQATLKALNHGHQTNLHTTTKAKDALRKETATAQHEVLSTRTALAARRAEVKRLRHTLSTKEAEIEGLKKRVLIHEARSFLPPKPALPTDDTLSASDLASTATGSDPPVVQSRYPSNNSRTQDRGQDKTVDTTSSTTTITTPAKKGERTAEPDAKPPLSTPLAGTESLTDAAEAEREEAELAAQRAQLLDIELVQEGMDRELERTLLREERSGVMRSWGSGDSGNGSGSGSSDSGDSEEDEYPQGN